MFPKNQRIVKTKEIQKALKAPFRGSCLFGQILLSPKLFSSSQKILKSKDLRVVKSAKIIANIKNPRVESLPLPKPDLDENLIPDNVRSTQISTTSSEGELLLSINQTLEQDKADKNNLKLNKDSKRDFSNNQSLTRQNLSEAKNFCRKPKQAESIVSSTKETSKFRLLCVVSKKIHKKANQRNKIRRRILAIFSQLRAKKRLPPNIDCVIIIRNKDILTATFDQYKQAFVPAVASLYQKFLRKIN